MNPFVLLSLSTLLFLAPVAAGGEPGPTAQEAGPPVERSAAVAAEEELPGGHSLSVLDRLLAEIEAGVEVPEGPAVGTETASGGLSSVGPAAAGSSPSFDTTGLSPAQAAHLRALAQYGATGEAPVLGTPSHRVYPHGHQVPVVRCLPLHACDLVFEAGETLTGWALGDSERWLVEALASGAGEDAQPHLLLKPIDYELATNLVVLTDRRTYRLELESPSHEEVHQREEGEEPAAYDLTLSWWYPDEWVQRRTVEEVSATEARQAAEARRRRAVELQRAFSPEELSFDYEIRQPWRRSRRLPWRPVTVFDDGQQVFLRLPEAARRGELPVLLGVLEDGGHYPLNARVEGEWMVVPVLFERAELVLGTGERRRSLAVVSGPEAGQ